VTRATVLSSLLLGAAALALGACGGDDDTSSATVASTDPQVAEPTPTPQVTAAPTPAATPTPTTPEVVTEGATVVVANASSVNGAAGRLSERLAAAGFTMGEATNSSETLGTTKVYFNASVDGAQAVAESLVVVLGGGDITAEPLPTPAPLSNPETIGDATVLVAMGEDVADKSLDELQGGTTTDTSDPDSTDPGTTTDTSEPEGGASG